MAYPDLYNDESVLLNAQNVKVKSVTFEAVLTTKRLILVDSKKHLIAPQEILLATLRNVDSGENAIRDPTVTLSLITNSGATRQMILTFFKASGGDRKRECDEWIRLLRQNISPNFQHQVHSLPDIPPQVSEPVYHAPEPVHPPEPQAPPRIEITNAPQPKKKIEIARPIMKIVENPPTMPKPVETTSLPVGSFCNRCGNRVPPESAFCNRCGTPVVREPGEVPPQPEPVPEAAAPAPVLPASPPPAAIPQLHVPIPPPVFGSAAGERKERPIEQVIHSIEPLIEDSVPRTEPAPLIMKPVSAQAPAAASPPQAEPGADAAPPGEAAPAPDSAGVQWPVIAPAGAAAPEPAPAAAETPSPVPPPAPRAPKASGKKYIAIALAIVIILAVIGSAFLFLNPQDTAAPPVTPATTQPTPTPAPADTAAVTPQATVPVMTAATTAPAAAATAASKIVIPSTGVWIQINYPGVYAATYGTPGSESTRSDTGEHIYQVFTNTGIVVASIQKVDASGGELQVAIYKDGQLVSQKSTTVRRGIVELQVDLKPAPTPTTPAPVTVSTTAAPSTAGVNATANNTQKSA